MTSRIARRHRRRPTRALLAASVAVALGVSSAVAPTAARGQAAADASPAAQALSVTVKQLTGVVSASTDDGKTWKRVAVGDTFGPGTLFRTGLRSGVTCTVGSDQMFTLESLTTMRVEEAARTGGKEKTDLLMKYGAASYGIQAAGREYDAVIRTPGSTMAVRGTVVRVYDRPGFAPQAESFTGRALFRTARGTTVLGGRSAASAVQGSAAESALANTTVDPSLAGARTAGESAVISQQLSQGGVLGFDQRANIPVVRGGGPLPDASLPGSLPGRLSFALRWTGNADLNFIVDNQAGNQDKIIDAGFKPTELLFPGYGLNVSTSGGLIPFDHRGGKNGGTEIAYWQGSFPTGVYGVGALHASGADANFKINAYLDGQALPIFAFDAEGNVTRTNTFTGTLSNGGGDGAILFVPRNTGFEDLTPAVGDAVARQAVARALAAGPAGEAKPTKAGGVAAGGGKAVAAVTPAVPRVPAASSAAADAKSARKAKATASAAAAANVRPTGKMR
jgi:hypothetical protein